VAAARAPHGGFRWRAAAGASMAVRHDRLRRIPAPAGRRLDNRSGGQVQAFSKRCAAPGLLVANSSQACGASAAAVSFPAGWRAVAAAPCLTHLAGRAMPRAAPLARTAAAAGGDPALPVFALELLGPDRRHSPARSRHPIAYANCRGSAQRTASADCRRPPGHASWAARGMSIGHGVCGHASHRRPPCWPAFAAAPAGALWRRRPLVPIEFAANWCVTKAISKLTLLEGWGICPHDEAPAEFSQQAASRLSRLSRKRNLGPQDSRAPASADEATLSVLVKTNQAPSAGISGYCLPGALSTSRACGLGLRRQGSCPG